jgi:catechol 2,3-dioxygenase-like lactoylglutathione lyase family enzyme
MNASLQVITLPVSEPDKSLDFYRDMLGFTLEVDYAPSAEFRVIQLTPQGSCVSVQFGAGLTDVVADIVAVRDELIDRGVGVSSIRHKDTDTGQWLGRFRLGPDPQRRDYASFADFSDPDGNAWVLQEIGHQTA